MTKYINAIFISSISIIFASCGGGGSSSTTDTDNPTAENFFNAKITIDGTQGGVPGGVGDFNGDGFDDVIVTYAGIPSPDITTTPHTKVPIKVFLQDGAGGFVDGTASVFNFAVPVTQFTRDISVADFNGDGQVDIFLGAHGLEIAGPDPAFPQCIFW